MLRGRSRSREGHSVAVPRYVVPMPRGKAAAGLALNTAVFLVMSVLAVVALVRSSGFSPSGWLFVAPWALLVVAIFGRNTVVCLRRRYVVWRPSWLAPPSGGQQLP